MFNKRNIPEHREAFLTCVEALLCQAGVTMRIRGCMEQMVEQSCYTDPLMGELGYCCTPGIPADAATAMQKQHAMPGFHERYNAAETEHAVVIGDE